jgi:hypothetical protein
MCKRFFGRSVSGLCGRQAGLLVLVVFLATAGCGHKGMPRPSGETGEKVIALEAQVQARGVEVSWTIPDAMFVQLKGGASQFVVQRAELSWENRACRECPATFEDRQAFDVTHPKPATLDGRRYIWLDTAVERQRAYRYQVKLITAKGRTTSVSTPVVVKIVPAPGPLPRLTAVGEGQGILLRWQKPQKDHTGNSLQGPLRFLVDRSPSGRTPRWERISPMPVDGSEFLDSTVASEQIYDYRVTPVVVFEDTTIAGEPGFFKLVTAPDTVKPPPPQSVWVIPGRGQMEVHWIESEGKVAGYHVYRRRGEEITRLTAQPLKHPPYLDNHAKKDESYSYAVSAVSPSPHLREGLLSKWVEIRNVFFE